MRRAGLWICAALLTWTATGCGGDDDERDPLLPTALELPAKASTQTLKSERVICDATMTGLPDGVEPVTTLYPETETMEVRADWLTVSYAYPTSATSLTVKADANQTGRYRSMRLIVNANGAKHTIDITQKHFLQ